MLACIQRRQNFSSQHEFGPPKVLAAPPIQLSLSVPPLQPCSPKGDPAFMASRYPSPAELDAFAQKTGNSPLSIKIFPSNIRVPQHKQLSRTVNGLDTTGHRYSPCSHAYSGGNLGLLAVVNSPVVLKGVVKNPEGKRTKKARTQRAGAPYDDNNNNNNNNNNNPLNNSYTAAKHKTYPTISCKPPDMPNETLSSGTMMAGQSQAPQADMHRLRQVNSNSQALHPGGEARATPTHRAVAAVAGCESGLSLGAPPRSSLAFSGAVLPSQSADVAQGGYGVWQHKGQHHVQSQQQQQQNHHHLRMYTSSGSPEAHRPLPCSAQLPYRPHPPSPGRSAQERVSPTTLCCAAMHGGFSVGHYFAPPWDSDCYTSQELGTGSCMGRPRDMGLSNSLPHPHPNHHPHRHQPQHQHPQIYIPPPPQAYSTDQILCCGLPSSSLCHASVLSSSLQSLECLISEIQPPCIKERMLGRGYQALGLPQLLESHQKAHIQLPVYR